MFTTITTSTIAQHVATEDELVLLGQVIDIDGRDAVVLASTAAKNGSGRVIGEHLAITDEAWQFVAESLTQGALRDDDISDNDIAGLAQAAGQAGDLEMVELCDRALAGDTEARTECEAAIRNGRG